MNQQNESKEDHISLREIRPRFRVESPYSMEELMSKLKNGIENPEASCIGKVIHGHATFSPPVKEQHYWSPQLGLSFEMTEKGTLLRGLYGPRPEVWTMFVLFYSIIGLSGLVVLIIGMSQLSLGKTANVLWLVPVLGSVFLTLFLVANRGKKLGYEQIQLLHHFLERTLGFPIF